MDNQELLNKELNSIASLFHQGDKKVMLYTMSPKIEQPVFYYKKKADAFNSLFLLFEVDDSSIVQGYSLGNKLLHKGSIFITEIWVKQSDTNEAVIYLVTDHNNIIKFPDENGYIKASFKLFTYNYTFFHLCVWDSDIKGKALSLTTYANDAGRYFSTLILPYFKTIQGGVDKFIGPEEEHDGEEG